MTWHYEPPLEDLRFVIDEWLGVRADWARMPRFAQLDADVAGEILEQGAKFVVESLAPINAGGDAQGCRYASGMVTTPDGFAATYRRYCDAGWPSLSCDVENGGQGLPQLLNAAFYEMLNAVNHAWTMYPGLTHAAYACVRAFAPEHVKANYLPRIVSGEWLSTMCLTEPQAGSDVGLIRTRAEPQADGSYAVSGVKIFISGGEHDLTDNIVHLVLARLPDAPIGTRGISLFLVPKFLTEGGLPRRNGVYCDGIEKKMGIKGSATCAMRFDAATGWLIGTPNQGLGALFVMMNSARLFVGLQGLGHAEMAYQNAVRYAEQRLQMRAVARPEGAAAPHSAASGAVGPDPIAMQPAVRRTLLTLRAFVEGERALGLWAAHLLDVAEHHGDATQRSRAHGLVSLLTPIIKSFFTENGFVLASAALQVWGGYGYIQDYGIEQTLRDSRVAMLYEGTNEIQAVDLLVRKVSGDGGREFGVLSALILDESRLCVETPGCEQFGAALGTAHAALARVTAALVAETAAEPEVTRRASGDFLRLVGLLLLGTVWARAARLAAARVSEPFYRLKMQTAQFYFDHVLPEANLRLELLERRRCPLPWIAAVS
jgi:alkylation response protein AidB-like acyl-CoA dehydrogenase